MHCMTWYAGTCSIMAMGLLYRLDNMIKCVYVIWALDPMVVRGRRSLNGWLLQDEHH